MSNLSNLQLIDVLLDGKFNLQNQAVSHSELGLGMTISFENFHIQFFLNLRDKILLANIPIFTNNKEEKTIIEKLL